MPQATSCHCALRPKPCACSSLGAPSAGAPNERPPPGPLRPAHRCSPAAGVLLVALRGPPPGTSPRRSAARSPPPPPGAALTVAPWLLRPAGDSQGGRCPGPRRARGSAERVHGPQVAGHPEHARSERAAAPGCAPGTRLAWVAGTQPGRSCGARRPIGSHPGEGGSRAGAGACPPPLGLFQSPGRRFSAEPALSGCFSPTPEASGARETHLDRGGSQLPRFHQDVSGGHVALNPLRPSSLAD